jgi:hypothetical protein
MGVPRYFNLVEDNMSELLSGIEINNTRVASHEVENMPIVCCPSCGWENVHMLPSKSEGFDGDWPMVIIPMWCECDHKWELCLCYHKGYTFSFVRDIGKANIIRRSHEV